MSRTARVLLVVGFTAVIGCGPKPTPTQGVPVLAPTMPTTPAPPSDADPREASKRNMATIGAALHQYHDANGQFPAGVFAADGVGLSWRVQLLPHLGHEALYKQFHLTETWDSEHNKTLIGKMPAVFGPPGERATHVRAFTGERAFIYAPPPGLPPPPRGAAGSAVRGRTFTSFSDGLMNTLIVAEADPVVWTKPDELRYDGNEPTKRPLPKLGGAFPGGFHGLMADAKVYWFPDTTREDTLRAAITADGGEVIDFTPIKFPDGVRTPDKPPTEVPLYLTASAARRTAVQRLHAVWAAWTAFHDAHQHFPAGVIHTKQAVGLSWRVQLLPHLGHEALYKQFHLTETWDSEHNKKLLDAMPEVYASPGIPTSKGHTRLVTTRGPQGVIYVPPGQKPPPFTREPGQSAPGRKLTEFLDGPSLTILLTEGVVEVPWTKPDDLELLPAPQAEQKTPGVVRMVPPKLGGVFIDGFHAVLVDGTVAYYTRSMPAETLSSLLTVTGGEVVEPLPADGVLYAVPPKK